MSPLFKQSQRYISGLVDCIVIGLGVFNVWVGRCALPPTLILELALLTAAALLFRRRIPIVAFVATLPAAALIGAVLGSMAALYMLARSSTHRWIVIAAAAVLDLTLIAGRQDLDFRRTDPEVLLLDAVLVLLIGTAPAALGWLAAAQHQVSQQMAELNRASTMERQLLIAAARQRERAELAREMHDVVSHHVSLIAVQAGAMQMVSSNPDTRERAGTIRRLSVETLDELRHMVNVLRDPAGENHQLCPQPTVDAIPRLLMESGLRIETIGRLPEDLSPAYQRAVYRTIQEALTNVHKHAPAAAVTVAFNATDPLVSVAIANEPSGEPVLALPGAGSGILGLRQRAELLGGTVTAGPNADHHWVVELRLPRS
ncbi:sensor histidine kinase [Nocardia sp. NPDC004722]